MPLKTFLTRWLAMSPENPLTTPAVQLVKAGAQNLALPAKLVSKNGCGVMAALLAISCATVSKACAKLCPPAVMKNGT